jgi:hypothetical protein
LITLLSRIWNNQLFKADGFDNVGIFQPMLLEEDMVEVRGISQKLMTLVNDPGPKDPALITPPKGYKVRLSPFSRGHISKKFHRTSL